MAFLYTNCTVKKTENVRADGEFRDLILATTVWFEVLVGFLICLKVYVFFCYFKNKKLMLRIQLPLNLMAHKLTPVRKGPSLISHRIFLCLDAGIGKVMRHTHMAHNFLKRHIINLLTGPKMRRCHVMAAGYFMMSTFVCIISYVLTN